MLIYGGCFLSYALFSTLLKKNLLVELMQLIDTGPGRWANGLSEVSQEHSTPAGCSSAPELAGRLLALPEESLNLQLITVGCRKPSMHGGTVFRRD